MKFTSIFSIILLAHMGLIGLLLVQPGCKSQSVDSGPPPQAQTQAPRSGGDTDRSDSTSRSGDLDPAFNAGLNGSGSSTASTSDRRSGGLSQPTRPPQTATSTPSRTRSDEDLSGGILQPLGSGDSGSRTGQETASSQEYRTYEVSPGDTLTHIARRQGVSLADLLEANGLSRDSTIFVGQSLRILGSGNGAAATASTSGSRSTPTASGTSYEVRSGDTLSGIASRHNTTVAQIRSANQLRSDTIRVGQTLVIPNGAESGSSRSPSASASSTPSSSGNGQVHTVESGETPTHIARRYGISVSALMEANGITDARRIQVGQRLSIPGGTGSSERASSTTATRERSDPAPRSSTTSSSSRDSQVSLIDSTTSPRNIEERPSQPSIMDLELLDDEDLPFSDVERVDD